MQCNRCKNMVKEHKYSKIYETLELVDKGDPDINIGFTYLAKNNEDVFIGLDKLKINDCLGAFLYIEKENFLAELTINCVDTDGYICSLEADNANEDGSEVDKTAILSKGDTIEFLNSLFTEYTVINKTKTKTKKAKQAESMNIKELSETLDKILSESTNITTTKVVNVDKFGKTWEIDKEYKSADCQLYNRPDYEKAGLITIYAPKEGVRGKWKTVVDFYLDKEENEPAHFELITDDCPTNRMIQYTVEKEAKEKYKKVVKLNVPRTEGIRRTF